MKLSSSIRASAGKVRRYGLQWLKRSPRPGAWNIDARLQQFLESTARLSSGQLETFGKKCLDQKTPSTYVYEHVADHLFRYAEPELSAFFFERLLTHHPRADLHSRLLCSIYLSPATDNIRLFAAAVDYHRRYYSNVTELAEPLDNVPDPNRRIRLGLICGFFTNTVSRGLLLPFLSALNRSEIEVVLYDNGDEEAGRTVASRAADLWRYTRNLDDRQLAQLIRRDKVDVLIELNGHLPDVRYGTMALRAAPVQVNWYNWHATTGLPFVDCTFVAPAMVPPEDEIYYVERVIRMPRASGAFLVPPEAPPPAPAPFHRKQRTTLGCFGASHKLNDAIFGIWAQLLQNHPNFDLLLKNATLDEPGFRDRVQRFFRARGIDNSRLILRGFSDYATMLSEYADVDIALDTWPHNGGATTHEALCQGVPIVTLKGDRANSRAGYVILSGLDLEDLVAHSADGYMDIVAKLAADRTRLDMLRSQLREKVKSSLFADKQAWCEEFQNAVRSSWRSWCETQASGRQSRLE